MIDADLIRSYGEILGRQNWYSELQVQNRMFRDKHHIGAGHHLHRKLNAIFDVNALRIDEKSSPAECAEVVGKVMAT